MNDAIAKMLTKYNCVTAEQYKHALKEIIQEIALLAMARSKFFEHGAFYGGTALRLFYGIERFSEDLDFSLLKPKPDFDLNAYCSAIQNELLAFGFTVTVEKKEKNLPQHTQVHSAFVKANTLTHLMSIQGMGAPHEGIHRNEILKIKIEVDTDPPVGAGYDVKYLQEPIPFSVKLYDQSSMFAGKMHALLCRNLDTVRVKGRDLFDAVWYIGHKIPINAAHLKARLVQTGHYASDEPLTEKKIRELFNHRMENINLDLAKKDAFSFVRDPFALEVWSKDFFSVLANQIVVAE